MVDQAERHADQQCQDCSIIEHIHKVDAKDLLRAQVKQILGSKAWQARKIITESMMDLVAKAYQKYRCSAVPLDCWVPRQSIYLTIPYTRY